MIRAAHARPQIGQQLIEVMAERRELPRHGRAGLCIGNGFHGAAPETTKPANLAVGGCRMHFVLLLICQLRDRFGCPVFVRIDEHRDKPEMPDTHLPEKTGGHTAQKFGHLLQCLVQALDAFSKKASCQLRRGGRNIP